MAKIFFEKIILFIVLYSHQDSQKVKPTESRDHGGKMMRASAKIKRSTSLYYFLGVFIFNLKNLCIMDFQNTHQSLSDAIRSAQEKRICIRDKVFILGNNNVLERKELLCSKYFKHNREDRNEVVHLSYNNSFRVRNKRLSVSVRYFTSKAPYGDRVHVKAFYDGVCIGDFGLIKSTIGAGANGKWPQIKNLDWQLLIKLELDKNERGYMQFYIEYFEKIRLDLFYEQQQI